ncbi:MAG: hypothetical protein ACXADH_15780 [Candidatus Kariarchaeaceae archaeon]
MMTAQKDKKTPQYVQPEDDVPAGKVYYFNNALVERLLYTYVEGACIDVKLRDEIMSHASELIRQIIRANNLHTIYPGRDDSSFGDLFQVGWAQIESVLYKYEALPHCLGCYNKMRPQDSALATDMVFIEDLVKVTPKCLKCGTKVIRESVYYRGKSKVFNMWSQVARTVVLAHIKRESRDRKNYPNYQAHLEKGMGLRSYVVERFVDELREKFKFNEDYVEIINAIERLYKKDDKAYEGFIAKLSEESGRSRSHITNFLKLIRLRSFEFTDVPSATDGKVGMSSDKELDDEENM